MFLNSDIARENADFHFVDKELHALINQQEQVYYDAGLPKSAFNSWIDNSSNKDFTYYFVLQQDIIDQWVDLNLKFNHSFEEKGKMFTQVSENDIKSDFQKSLRSILAFYPEKISVGISEDECAFIYFEKDGKVIYFDLFFEPQQKTEASVTVFENKESKVSFTDYLDNSIRRLNRELCANNEL